MGGQEDQGGGEGVGGVGGAEGDVGEQEEGEEGGGGVVGDGDARGAVREVCQASVAAGDVAVAPDHEQN